MINKENSNEIPEMESEI